MKGRLTILFLAGLMLTAVADRLAFPTSVPPPQTAEDPTPEAGGEHLRVETEHGPFHLWWPADYNPRTAGTVIYVHGYSTSVDQAWTDDRLAGQFRASRRNALFIAIEAPEASEQDVCWKSLEELLLAVEDLSPFPLPRGPLVVVGHSAAYRTILGWLDDPRVQQIVLLDGLYGGQPEFHAWLRRSPRGRAHRLVLVSFDTRRQANRFARRTSGTIRRRSIPVKSSSFTPRDLRARLLYLRSQYDHNAIVSNGKVIPVLLQISRISPLVDEDPQPPQRHPSALPALDR